MQEKFSLKDHLFNEAKVRGLSQEILAVYPAFEAQRFVKEVLDNFPQLELKARIDWIRICLKQYLPGDYRKAVEILLKALPPECNPELQDDDFGDFIYAPYSEFVARYGCQTQELEFSLTALKAITTRFSAENALRSFINAFPEQTFKTLLEWTADSHYHVRRLASEGTRPRLPWCPKINTPPAAALPILDKLHADPTRFVTRSVANHLNDLSKINPAWVLDRLQNWREQKLQSAAELDYLSRHALRSLIKQGHPETLQFLGYTTAPEASISKFSLASKQVKIGESLVFSFEITGLRSEKLVVDYSIYFRSKKADLKPKVFKLKSFQIEAGQSVQLQKKHLLKLMSTRQLYPGQHQLEIQINGQSFGKHSFELLA